MTLINLLLKVFPAGWRERYEDEFLAVLEQSGIRPIDYVNILMAAIDAHLHPELHRKTPGQNTSGRADRAETPVGSSVPKLQSGFYPGISAVGISSAVAPRRLNAVDRLKKVNCIICRNDFFIPLWDYRSRELKHNPSKPCVCDNCSYSLRKEAMIISGIGPEDLEKLDRIDRITRY